MNIIYVASVISLPNTSGEGSGGSTHTLEVARHLSDLGHQVQVLCRKPKAGQKRKDVIEGISILRVLGTGRIYSRLKRRRRLWRVLKPLYHSIRAARESILIIRTANRNRCELLYERSDGSSAACTIAAILLRRPLVLEINDQSIFPFSLRVATEIVTPSISTLPKQYARKVTELEWGVDVQRFKTAATREKPAWNVRSSPLVMFIGSGLPWHGLNLITAAAPGVLRQFPGAQFIIVGAGPSIEDAAQQVQRLGLSSAFHFLGAVSYPQIPSILAHADIALAPYTSALAINGRHLYASPLKTFEYMAAGKAIILSEVANTRQIIEHMVSGIVIPTDDAAAMQAAIILLSKRPCLKESLARNAQAAVEQKYSWQAHCASLEQVFSRAITANGGGVAC